MEHSDDVCVVTTATGSEAEAEALAESLVAERLAACVQVLPMHSVYRWRGKVCREPEWLLLIKTTDDRYSAVERHIRERHGYELPEVLRFPADGGLPEYLQWVAAETKDERLEGDVRWQA